MITIDADYENGWSMPIRHSIRKLIQSMQRDSSYKFKDEILGNCLHRNTHNTSNIHLEYKIDTSD